MKQLFLVMALIGLMIGAAGADTIPDCITATVDDSSCGYTIIKVGTRTLSGTETFSEGYLLGYTAGEYWGKRMKGIDVGIDRVLYFEYENKHLNDVRDAVDMVSKYRRSKVANEEDFAWITFMDSNKLAKEIGKAKKRYAKENKRRENECSRTINP